MKIAVVTGTSSGIGLEICRRLLEQNYRVYGLARSTDVPSLASSPEYIHLSCDLSQLEQLEKRMRLIKAQEKKIDLLVNNAGIGYFGLHDQLQPQQISEMILINLQAPLLITRHLLPQLKKAAGFIINISSITAKKTSTHGCAYAATKAGLTHFSQSLFEEVRKHNVKVVVLHPDITQTPFYDHLDFQEGKQQDSYITASCVADALEMVLEQRQGTVLSELTIRPQKHLITKKSSAKNG